MPPLARWMEALLPRRCFKTACSCFDRKLKIYPGFLGGDRGVWVIGFENDFQSVIPEAGESLGEWCMRLCGCGLGNKFSDVCTVAAGKSWMIVVGGSTFHGPSRRLPFGSGAGCIRTASKLQQSISSHSAGSATLTMSQYAEPSSVVKLSSKMAVRAFVVGN